MKRAHREGRATYLRKLAIAHEFGRRLVASGVLDNCSICGGSGKIGLGLRTAHAQQCWGCSGTGVAWKEEKI